MPRFAANLSLLFRERPMLERIAAAREAGFDGVEVQFPYAFRAEDWAAAADRAGLPIVLINIPAGDPQKGERGLGCLPDRVEEFRAGVALAQRYAERLKVARVNLLAGVPAAGANLVLARATLAGNLRYAAKALGEVGITVCLEAINTRDVPGFFVSDPDQAVAILDDAGATNTALQYDLYHMQIMRGDLIPTLERLLPRIGHIQFADTPGRHEPGTGEINFASIFAAIDRIGYTGWVGAEYNPSGSTAESLGWLRQWRIGPAHNKLSA